MIEICNDKTKLTPLEYILNNNDVKIDIEFNYDLYLINDKLKKTFDDKIDTIIYYLSYYGIDYYNYYNDYYNDMGICYMHFDDNLSFGHMRTLNIAKDDLEILDKDQMINLLNSILDIAKNSDFIKLEIKHYDELYDLGYNPYQE